MHFCKVTLLLLYMAAIASTKECVFFPSMEPPRVILCQGYEIVSFPPVSESVAGYIEEIYISSTTIKCIDSNAAIFTKLEIFTEHGNPYWSCDCMDSWISEVNSTVSITTDCQSQSSFPPMTSSEKDVSISTLIKSVTTNAISSAESTDAITTTTTYEFTSDGVGAGGNERELLPWAVVGAIALGVGVLTAAATAIIIAVGKVGHRPTGVVYGGGG